MADVDISHTTDWLARRAAVSSPPEAIEISASASSSAPMSASVMPCALSVYLKYAASGLPGEVGAIDGQPALVWFQGKGSATFDVVAAIVTVMSEPSL